MPKFTDETIERLFGAEDAENETTDRFREYFVFNQSFESVRANLPIKIVVGHKGIGKSALLRRAYLEDQDQKVLAVWLRPNDLAPNISSAPDVDFNLVIENWKSGLLSAVASKIAEDTVGDNAPDFLKNEIGRSIPSALRFLSAYLKRKLPELREVASKELVERFLKDHRVNVYIDDIDRGWAASRSNISNISALLNAVRDLSGGQNSIQFRIGLRSDVYFLVRTSDESTDKIERHVVWLSWTNHEILCIMAKRIATFFNMNILEEEIRSYEQSKITSSILSRIIDPRFQGVGHWKNKPIHNVLLSLTRKRPRDLIKLMHGAAKNAQQTNNEIISSTNLEKAFEPYSNERLQDIINEFRSEMPQIADLLFQMRPTKKEVRASQSYLFSNDALVRKMRDEVMAHVTLNFTNNRQVTPQSLIQFLYKIDFITARKQSSDGNIDRKYFEQSRYLALEHANFGYDWEVHPAYRWALQPQNISDVIDSLNR